MNAHQKDTLYLLAKKDVGLAAQEALMMLRDAALEPTADITEVQYIARLIELRGSVLHAAGVIEDRLRRNEEVKGGW